MFNNHNAARFLGLTCLLGQAMAQAHAGSTDIADYPATSAISTPPNVLVIYDNSQSMDAFMNGTPVAGSHPDTRGNIGRSILRDTISKGRAKVKWGLMSFGLSGAPVLRNTYASYMGSDTGMVFTADCEGFDATNPPKAGVSVNNGGRRCIANPQSFSPGENYITFDKSGDDADIQSVLYDAGVYSSLWGIGTGGTTYDMYSGRNASAGNSWLSTDFTGPLVSRTFSSTDADAGFFPSASDNITRQLFTPRGWGYSAGVTGMGQLDVPVAADSDAQQSSLQSKLAGETSGATGELKNGAILTPLPGALQSAKSYFSGMTSPVQDNCQRNYVMLVTDGLPTGKADGTPYSAAERANTCNWSTANNSCTSGSFGTAAHDAIAAAKALRSTTVPGYSSTDRDGGSSPFFVTGKYDVKTYVVALGDTLANPEAMSVMNAIAHAGGTEAAIAAGDARALEVGISTILGHTRYLYGTTEPHTLGSPQIAATGNKIYKTYYNLGNDGYGHRIDAWEGEITQGWLLANGTSDNTTASIWGSNTPGVQLKSRTSANRFIATSTDVPGGRGGIQFQPTSAGTATKLSAAQQSLLGTPPAATDGAAVLAFLRGDQSQDGSTYRNRKGFILGPIINSGVVVVDPPNAGHTDAGYSAFKTAQASRARMLYVGANDGMLHAFDEATGAESWAYVPNLVMAGLNKLTAKTHFVHEQSVDATPVSADVDFGAGDWHTLLVGGLRKGGRGYYALDVTTAGAADEAAVANKVLWEFPNSISNATARASATQNMGYSFGKPLLVKTAAGWVVLVTSGYNNGSNAGDSGGDGLGHLYVINPKTGDLIRDIPTPACTASPATDPCGLAQITASLVGNTADYVYGGDLKGNLWRFNLTAASPAAWSVAKFTTLVDNDGATQPVTTAPALSTVSGKRIIQVGTGQLLGSSDFSTTQTQTMYGLRDTLPSGASLRSSLQSQTLSPWAGYLVSSDNSVDYDIKHGWYVDLNQPGERVNTTPKIDDAGNLIFTTTSIEKPAATFMEPSVCRWGTPAWVYFFSSYTGGRVSRSFNHYSGFKMGFEFVAAPLLLRMPDGSLGVISSSSSAYGQRGTEFGYRKYANAPMKIKRTWRQIYLY